MQAPIVSHDGITPRERLLSLIQGARLVDKETNKIILNDLWFAPTSRSEFSRIVADFVKLLPNISATTVLLHPEGVLSSFGSLPVASSVADILQCRLAIWRESGDVVTGKPSIYPRLAHIPKRLSCIVLQDVVSKGTTLRKVQPILQKLDWTVVYYIGIVQVTIGNLELQESFRECENVLSSEFKFLSILNDSDILGK